MFVEETETERYETRTCISGLCSLAFSRLYNGETHRQAQEDPAQTIADRALADGAINKIPGIGTVETRVDDLSYRLKNVTRSAHLFRDGSVTRSLVITQDAISVSTVGVGTNINVAAWVANYAAAPYFKGLDANTRVDIGIQQFKNDVRSFLIDFIRLR